MPDARLDLVFFDVDDTLYSTTAFAERARRDAIGAMIDAGLRVSLEQGQIELGEVVTEFASNYAEHFDRLIDRLGPEAYAGHNRAVLVAAGVVAYHRTKEQGLHILPDALEALEALHGAGVRLGVISAGLQVKQAEKLIRLGVLRFFDPTSIFFSDQVGVSKPNPKLYTLACKRAGVKPARALYIGDRPDHDVAPAAKAGLRTVYYSGAGGKYAGCARSGADHDLADLRALPALLRDVYHL
ncbi:MAG: TIGR02253 family HAD-type hydrolase [Planctomycetota bacterium]|nr:TIGR02253 family HAD-type hydrolase [Planctomycetota bacterium]